MVQVGKGGRRASVFIARRHRRIGRIGTEKGAVKRDLRGARTELLQQTRATRKRRVRHRGAPWQRKKIANARVEWMVDWEAGGTGPSANETRAWAEEEPDMGGPHGDGSDSTRARERLAPWVHLSALWRGFGPEAEKGRRAKQGEFGPR
jgi:hypothetical protein